MARDTTHPLLPRTDHDGMSRRLSILAAKQAIRSVLEPQLRHDFEADTTQRLEELGDYPIWSSLNRATQDRMWQVLSEQIDKDARRIGRVAEQTADAALGSLTLNENAAPEYLRGTHIHGQPGGYLLDRGHDDLGAGILYEAGGNLYALGQGIGRRDSKAQRLIQYIGERWPERTPRRILEMGCSAGAQSADYPAAFPDAQCHAIDVSAAMLRYALARTRALGEAVHFTQADAAHTPFPDAHFDLIVSHNLFHEVAAEHQLPILKECQRLLRPGGIVIHQDIPIQLPRLDPWMRQLSAWQKDNNDEPFWMDFASADFEALLTTAGFESETIETHYLKAVDGPIPWFIAVAQQSA